jgi:hypothetical protein
MLRCGVQMYTSIGYATISAFASVAFFVLSSLIRVDILNQLLLRQSIRDTTMTWLYPEETKISFC